MNATTAIISDDGEIAGGLTPVYRLADLVTGGHGEIFSSYKDAVDAWASEITAGLAAECESVEAAARLDGETLTRVEIEARALRNLQTFYFITRRCPDGSWVEI